MSKGPRKAKRVIFRGDNSLDALFVRLWETLIVFLTSHISGFLMEPIKDHNDIQGAIKNVQKGQQLPNG